MDLLTEPPYDCWQDREDGTFLVTSTIGGYYGGESPGEKHQSWMISLISQIALFWGEGRGGVVIQVDGLYIYNIYILMYTYDIYIYIYLFLLTFNGARIFVFFVAPTVLMCCFSWRELLTFTKFQDFSVGILVWSPSHVRSHTCPCANSAISPSFWSTKGGCEFHSQLWSRHQHLGSLDDSCVLFVGPMDWMMETPRCYQLPETNLHLKHPRVGSWKRWKFLFFWGGWNVHPKPDGWKS